MCELTPVTWVYSDLWYADGYELKAGAEPIYKMGPAGYVFDYLYSGLLNTVGNSHIFTFAVETARINNRANTDALFSDAITYFKGLNGIEVNQGSNLLVKNLFPNPTSNTASLVYELNNNADVSLKIVDITGKVIVNNNYGTQTKGMHDITISASSLEMNNGIYFYTLSIDNNNFSGKLIITK